MFLRRASKQVKDKGKGAFQGDNLYRLKPKEFIQYVKGPFFLRTLTICRTNQVQYETPT